ncbi:MAG: DUF4280 domain-containing protein [Thermomonas sp.]|nr:MAG: DUF4280 domain-containing protein [Thermomonas sp.]
MPFLVVNGATLKCPMAAPPGTTSMIVTPVHRVQAGNQPAANISDFAPMANVPSFGMCMSLKNPQVAAATSAAQGVLTPQPCMPAIVAPWSPGSSTVMLDNLPALNDTSTCQCLWGAAIMVAYAGQATVMIP